MFRFIFILIPQPDLCKEICDQLAESYPEEAGKSILIKTALICKTDGIQKATQFANTYIAKNPEFNPVIKLGLAQEMLRNVCS